MNWGTVAGTCKLKFLENTEFWVRGKSPHSSDEQLVHDFFEK